VTGKMQSTHPVMARLVRAMTMKESPGCDSGQPESALAAIVAFGVSRVVDRSITPSGPVREQTRKMPVWRAHPQS
jgi:hypothetical protein